MRWKQTVVETRTYTCEYIVEADNIEDAKNKVASGDVIEEKEIKLDTVNARDPWEDPVELFDPKRQFDSPRAAAEYCEKFDDPYNRLKEVINVNIELREYGFAAECVAELETLEKQFPDDVPPGFDEQNVILTPKK